MVSTDDLTRRLADLAERIERLERRDRAGAHPAADLDLVRQMVDRLEPGAAGTPGEATVFYAGTGRWGSGTVVWQMIRTWDEVLIEAGQQAAVLFAALAYPTRLRIVVELLAGELTTAQLNQRLDQPSSGQLFHHLRELLAAGIIHQPVRGTYAIAKRRVVPLLALLSAAVDVGPSVTDPSPEGDQP